MKLALSLNGLYVCAEIDTAGTVHADRSQIGSWERWTVERQPDGSIAFKSAHDRYLCAEGGGGGDAHADRERAAIWEQFRPTGVIADGARLAFTTYDRQSFLGVRGDDHELYAGSSVPVYFVVTVLEQDAQRVTVRDGDFWQPDGTRMQICGSTELMLAHLYDTQGLDAVLPIFDERHAIGFTNLRVLWQKDVRNQNKPWVMPLDKIPAFLLAASRAGFNVQGTILADCQVVNPDERFQQLRVTDVRRVTAGIGNHFETLGNEWEKNGFIPSHFSRPTDRLAANASSIEGGKDAPYWDFFVFSGQRSPLNHAIREYGPIEFLFGDGRGWGGVPAICDEGMIPGEHSSNPRDFERAGAQARSGNGGRFHSRAGSNRDEHMARPFTPLEKDCALAFVKGLKG